MQRAQTGWAVGGGRGGEGMLEGAFPVDEQTAPGRIALLADTNQVNVFSRCWCLDVLVRGREVTRSEGRAPIRRGARAYHGRKY